MDHNDIHGHVNNAACYPFSDTAVNRYLIDSGVLDFASSDVSGLVVETGVLTFMLPGTDEGRRERSAAASARAGGSQ